MAFPPLAVNTEKEFFFFLTTSFFPTRFVFPFGENETSRKLSESRLATSGPSQLSSESVEATFPELEKKKAII